MKVISEIELDSVSGGAVSFQVGGYTVSLGNNGLGGSLACQILGVGVGATAGILSLNYGVYSLTSGGVSLACNFATNNIPESVTS